MKFITLSSKTILSIVFILLAMTIFVSSSEISSTLKTNNQNKVHSKTHFKSNSILRLRKEYSMADPPGASTSANIKTQDLTKDQQAKAAELAKNSKELKNDQNNKVTILEPVIKNGTATNGTGDIIFNDWMLIRSKGFKDHFQEIQMGIHGNNHKILTDTELFRINDAFSKDTNKANQPHLDKVFWFRLSKDLIFYSSTKHDLNVLGGMRIADIVEGIEDQKESSGLLFCFEIIDQEKHSWQVCSEIEEVRNNWFCKIQELRNKANQGENGVPLPMYCYKEDNKNVIIKNIIQPYIIIPTPSRMCNENWNYQKHGDDWECDCAEGKEQSPINLPPKEQAIDSSSRPNFKFHKVQVSNLITANDGSKRETENLKIKLEENSLRIKYDNFGKIVTPDGSIYVADEIIIHTPGEHMINGKKFDMEIQVVCKGKTVGDIGKNLVLSFIFEKSAGVYNKFVDDLDFFNLPNPLSKSVDIIHTLFIPKILHNSDESDEVIYMKNFSFYTYQGSLTSPPCTEETIMYVNSKPIPIGTTALHMFQEALRVPDLIDEKGNVTVSDMVAASNRNVQPINGRPVFHYDHEKYCGPDPQKPPEVGHFERLKKVMNNYFYVSGKKISGLPNAFVVSKDEAYNIQPNLPNIQNQPFAPQPIA